MARVGFSDLDFLAARFHGRRSRMAEAERLDALCRLRSIPELAQAVFPGAATATCGEFQRLVVEDFLTELSHTPAHLDDAGRDLLTWLLVRFQVENMKVLLRGFLSRSPLETVSAYLVSLPSKLALNAADLLAAKTLGQFVDRLPREMPRIALRAVLVKVHGQSGPFCFEAALDQGYFQELLARAGQLTEVDRDIVFPLIEQEVNMFQLMLAVRGRFEYGLAPELLLPMHIRRCGIPTERFQAILAAADLRTVAALVLGRAIDSLPSEDESNTAAALPSSQLEVLAWKRFLRLANSAFRRSHMGLGAVVGYVGIRKVEVANLITLSEGIRVGMSPEVIRARLVPRHEQELTYV